MSGLIERVLAAILGAGVFMAYMRYIENITLTRKQAILRFIIVALAIFAVYLVAHTV